jgi:hypothetical protein
MFRHPLLYVWIVLIGAFVGMGLLRSAREVPSIAQSVDTSRPATGAASPATSVDEPKHKQYAAGGNRETSKPDQSKDEDSTKWTDRWIAYVTVALAAVAIAQFAAAGLQAKWTRRAVDVAKRSADIAEKAAEAPTGAVDQAARSVDIAKQALGTERAWLTFDQITPVTATNGRMAGVPFKWALAFKVDWKNLGRSPAVNPQLTLSIIPVAFDAADPPPRLAVDWNQCPVGFPIAPSGRSVYPAPLGIADGVLDSFWKREIAIVVFSSARYGDTFDSNAVHVSEVCLRIAYDGEQNMSDGSVRPNYETRAFGPQTAPT